MTTSGIRHDEMRKRNRALVISAVRQSGQCSRTQIAGTSGLSPSTISAIASDLMAEGIVRQVAQSESTPARRGRPQVAIGLNPQAAAVVCLYLSFNSLSAVLVDYCGSVIDTRRYRMSTSAIGRQELLDASISIIREITCDRAKVLHIAVAVQGITDSAGSELLWSPITPHSSVPFGPVLSKAFQLPVTVQNDCNMIAAALRWRNPERYGDNFAAILLSRGIGMGLVLNGKLFTGTQSSGGEFGHMVYEPNGALCRCGRRGCVEAYAGSYAIWRSAVGLSPTEEPAADTSADEMRALAALARRENGPARRAFGEAGRAIGFGIGNLFALIDPVPIAIIGQGTTAMDILEPEIRTALAQTAGGQHAAQVPFQAELNEVPLVQHGCAMTALTSIDREMFASGLRAETDTVREELRKSVA